MARGSRIRRPLGSLFLMVHHDDVEKIGFAGAAIIGELDFLDRAQEGSEFKPLATRARLIANLEGIVGKHAIDEALRHLASIGIIVRHEKTTMGDKNWIRSVTYGLDPRVSAGLSAFGTIGNSHSDDQNQDNPDVPKTDPELDPESGQDPGVTSNNEKEVKAEAEAEAEENSNSPAASSNQKKIRNRRKSGIVTWWPSDVAAAIEIESQHSQEDITAAVAEVKKGNQDPTPGLVQRELEAINDAREAKRRRHAEAEDLRKKVSHDLPSKDPAKVSAQIAGAKAALQKGAHRSL